MSSTPDQANARVIALQKEHEALMRSINSIQELRACVYDLFEGWQVGFEKKESATKANKTKACQAQRGKNQMVDEIKRGLVRAKSNLRQTIQQIPARSAVGTADKLIASRIVSSIDDLLDTPETTGDHFTKFQELAASAKGYLANSVAHHFPDVAMRMWTWTLSNQCSKQIQLSDKSSPLMRMLNEVELKHEGLSISRIARPGTPTDLQGLHLRYTRLFRVSIAFYTVHTELHTESASRIARVNIRGLFENTSRSDLWQESQIKAFVKLTTIASESAENFLSTLPTNIDALRHFIIWLSSYKNLFSAPCIICRRCLIHDSHDFKFLPPLVRTYSNYTPYHLQCYRQQQKY